MIWAVIAIGSSVAVIVFSIVLGVWSIWKMTREWPDFAGSLAEIQSLKSNGPKYYKADGLSTILYGEIKEIINDISLKKYEEAILKLQAIRGEAETNPLFDFLRAVSLYNLDKKNDALKAIDKGKRKGEVLLYQSEYVSPDKWQYPEYDLLLSFATKILNDYGNDQRWVLAVLAIADSLLKSNPPEPLRIIGAIDLRDEAAMMMLHIDGDRYIKKICENLVEENQKLREAIFREIGTKETIKSADLISDIVYAVEKRKPELRNYAVLLFLESRADICKRLRSEIIKTKIPEQKR